MKVIFNIFKGLVTHRGRQTLGDPFSAVEADRFWPEAAPHIAENIAWRPSAMRPRAAIEVERFSTIPRTASGHKPSYPPNSFPSILG